MSNSNLFPIFTLLSLFIYTCSSQQDPAPSPPPLNATCNGVYLSYEYTGGYRIPPTDNPDDQPHRFESTVTVLNNGRDELKSWRVFVGFRYNELLVSVNNAVLADGELLPASVGNGTIFAGFPRTDLKTAIETAGDTTQTEVRIQLVGTRFGNGDPDVPLPANLSLANQGYSCSPPQTLGNNTLQVCCLRDLGAKPEISEEIELQPRQEGGDLVIMYDVMSTYESDYWAQVTISNNNNLTRLDNWKLNWEWMRGEFIFAMKGALPMVKDLGDCIFGEPGQHYEDMDLSQAMSCEKRPTIIDLPPTRANDTDIGKIPFCCRNGTILPPIMDPTKSVSAFQMHVFKMPPDLNRTTLFPPQNWKINGSFSSSFQCGAPVAVAPSQFPDPTGLPSATAAVASWQVVCNATFRQETPKCCVSFSSFYNDSVVPCSTCACGCSNNPARTCSGNKSPLLLPSNALLIPFENRTILAKDWAKINKRSVPNPMPCGDNCGVTINWHLLSDYKRGWTARITLFNWGETDFADWSAAVQLDKAMPGFEKVYSFNGSALPNSSDTIFMYGLQDFNYLVAEREGKNPRKDFQVPGSLQSVISFTKKKTPDIDVAKGDGFPTKVYFNGQECALPALLPSNGHRTSGLTMIVLACLLALGLMLIH